MRVAIQIKPEFRVSECLENFQNKGLVLEFVFTDMGVVIGKILKEEFSTLANDSTIQSIEEQNLLFATDSSDRFIRMS